MTTDVARAQLYDHDQVRHLMCKAHNSRQLAMGFQHL